MCVDKEDFQILVVIVLEVKKGNKGDSILEPLWKKSIIMMKVLIWIPLLNAHGCFREWLSCMITSLKDGSTHRLPYKLIQSWASLWASSKRFTHPSKSLFGSSVLFGEEERWILGILEPWLKSPLKICMLSL